VTFEGRTVQLRDLKGVGYVARLLADPTREVHVLSLITGEWGRSADASRGQACGFASLSDLRGDVFLDAGAKAAYRRRLAEIEEDIEEAQATGNDDRAAQAETERDFLVRELAARSGWAVAIAPRTPRRNAHARA
jgi:hypothetical protein